MAIFKTLLLALPLALAAPTTLEPRATGSMTWYQPGLGACGKYNVETDMIAAISASRYDAAHLCGRHINIRGPTGKRVKVKIVDRCVGCGHDDVDLSPAAFEAAIGKLGVGRANAIWKWA